MFVLNARGHRIEFSDHVFTVYVINHLRVWVLLAKCRLDLQ